MKKHLIVVPRWGGTPHHDWYPWLSGVLAEQNLFESVHIAEMPNPGAPTIAGWRDALLKIIEVHSQHLNDVVLVGHSVGCQAVLHALQALPDGQQMGAVFVLRGGGMLIMSGRQLSRGLHTNMTTRKLNR